MSVPVVAFQSALPYRCTFSVNSEDTGYSNRITITMLPGMWQDITLESHLDQGLLQLLEACTRISFIMT